MYEFTLKQRYTSSRSMTIQYNQFSITLMVTINVARTEKMVVIASIVGLDEEYFGQISPIM